MDLIGLIFGQLQAPVHRRLNTHRNFNLGKAVLWFAITIPLRIKKSTEVSYKTDFLLWKRQKGCKPSRRFATLFILLCAMFTGKLPARSHFQRRLISLTSAKILKNIVKNVHFGFAEIASLACGRTEFLNQFLNNFYLRSWQPLRGDARWPFEAK